MSDTTDAVTVTTVRKALIAESYEHHKLRREYFAVLKGEKPLPDAAAVHAYEALADAGCWEYAVAGMLRRVEAVNPELAAELADLAAWVLESGNEALEDANDDLDEQVRAGGDAAGVVEPDAALERPEIDVTVGAPVQIYYEFPDPFTGQTSGRRVPCTIVKVDPDYFWARPDRLGRGSIGNEFRFHVDTLKAHDFNHGWHVEAVDAR